MIAQGANTSTTGEESSTARDSDPEFKGDDKKKKERPKSKRKKPHDRQIPRLTVLNLEDDGEMVECQLETAKHSAVIFKFNRENDQPDEIADNLVGDRAEKIRTWLCHESYRNLEDLELDYTNPSIWLIIA